MRRSICLTMIVKDEVHVLKRCLDSVIPLIDAWCVVDTGSSDGTQSLVRECLASVPGRLYERPWVNFGHNRTESIELARSMGDYLLFLDADEVVQAPPGFEMPELISDAYSLLMGAGDTTFWREILVSSALPWRYVGVLHEYLTTDRPHCSARLEGPLVYGHFDGGRSKGLETAAKYRRDAAVLEKAVKDEPENTRYAFYLAQSYRDGNLLRQSIDAYRRRAAMGGWDEEVWYSLFQVAGLSEQCGLEPDAVVASYLAAYQNRPTRAEPLVYLAAFHRKRGEHALAHLYAQQAVRIGRPSDMLFLDESCYSWRARDEYAVSRFYLGDFFESLRICEELLSVSDLPPDQRERVAENLRFADEALKGNQGKAG